MPTLPFRLRFLVAFNRTLCRKIRAVRGETVHGWLPRQARRRGLQGAEAGSVCFVQRFGSALNAFLAPDAALAPDPSPPEAVPRRAALPR